MTSPQSLPQTFHLILVGRSDYLIGAEHVQQIQTLLAGQNYALSLIVQSPLISRWAINLNKAVSYSVLRNTRRQIERITEKVGNFDVFLAPAANLSEFKLLAMDMDSTLINIECIDEIAAAVHKKTQVARITADTMSGKIKDFGQSLRERVALLKGCTLSELEHIYNHVLKINQGGDILVKTAQTQQLKTAIVSGGFDFFADRVATTLDVDFTVCNMLDIQQQKVTGRLRGELVDAEFKALAVDRFCQRLDATPNHVLVIGDGSNDLKMMDLSFWSVGYHAKPVVQEEVAYNIRFGGLHTTLALFQDTQTHYETYENTQLSTS
jgi:phosphoserine phosphatase